MFCKPPVHTVTSQAHYRYRSAVSLHQYTPNSGTLLANRQDPHTLWRPVSRKKTAGNSLKTLWFARFLIWFQSADTLHFFSQSYIFQTYLQYDFSFEICDVNTRVSWVSCQFSLSWNWMEYRRHTDTLGVPLCLPNKCTVMLPALQVHC